MTTLRALLAIVLLAGLACTGGGVYLIAQRETGLRTKARVTDCSGGSGRYGTQCTGTWVVGGSLVGGGGHVVDGPIDGAASDDVGKTIAVTVSGDHAYSRRILLPILLVVLGLPFVAFGGYLLISDLKRSRPGPSTQMPVPQ